MVVTHYKPSKRVLAIVPKWTEYGEPYAEVYEEHRVVNVSRTARKVVDEILQFTGQTMRGAKDGSVAILGKEVYCAPIVVNEVHDMYMLFTGPVNKEDTAYIMLHAVKDSDVDPGGTLVTLTNDMEIHLNINEKLFKKRVAGAAHLRFVREQRTALMLRYYQYCAEHKEKYGDDLNKK